MIWRKHQQDTWLEYSANCGPVAFWIQDVDGDFDTVIHYSHATETAVLPDLETAKSYCKTTAIRLLKETLATVEALEADKEWEPK